MGATRYRFNIHEKDVRMMGKRKEAAWVVGVIKRVFTRRGSAAGRGSLIAHCDVCSKCKPDDLSSIIGKHSPPARPRPRMNSLSLWKNQNFMIVCVLEKFHSRSRCGNIWKAIKMQPYDDTPSSISLTHSSPLSLCLSWSGTTGGIITSEKQISIKSYDFHRHYFPGMRGSHAFPFVFLL